MVNLTISTKPVKAKEIKRDWHLIDASSKILGRVAPEIVKVLQGKHKRNYVPYLDMGDYVVVVNAKKSNS
jgi:LSU ribosomal protein L13P